MLKIKKKALEEAKSAWNQWQDNKLAESKVTAEKAVEFLTIIKVRAMLIPPRLKKL